MLYRASKKIIPTLQDIMAVVLHKKCSTTAILFCISLKSNAEKENYHKGKII